MARHLDIVLVHGWGLNSAIWQNYARLIESRFPAVRCHAIDIPGYGGLSDQVSSQRIGDLAVSCLNQAPEKALWVGWSLGGLISMSAATISPDRVQALQLVNTTPKFVVSDDWSFGVEIDIFQKFCDELASDYQRVLATFLLLQAGANKGARELAKLAHDYVSQYPAPSKHSLQAGIDCLKSSDLRSDVIRLSAHDRPVQVIAGGLDRVTKPESSNWLAKKLEADLVVLKSGHAPFMTHSEEMLNALTFLVERIN